MGVPPQEAAMRAREVNIDFARAGTKGRRWNRVAAFFNSQVQGTDKFFRTVRNKPGETLLKGILFGQIPSVITWALANLLGDDDERKEYEEIPRIQKDLCWVFRVNGVWLRIPKPNIWGIVFGSLTERVLDAAYKKDKGAFRGLEKSMRDQMLPPLLPNLATTGIEVITNYNFFTGRPIVSDKYERLPPEMQYGPQTSEAAILLGEAIGVSPLKIDHVVRGIGGTMWGEGVKLCAMINCQRSTPTLKTYSPGSLS